MSSSNGLYGKCKDGHVFLVAAHPMPVREAVKLARRAACPHCGATTGILVASAEEIRTFFQTEQERA